MAMNYMVEELNKDFQCELPYIPEGTYDTALYDYSVEDKKYKNMWISSGYSGYKSLEFFGKPPENGYYFEGEKLGSVTFPNFKTAYEFIMSNNLPNYNLRCDCYKKEIKQYEKEKSNAKNSEYIQVQTLYTKRKHEQVLQG